LKLDIEGNEISCLRELIRDDLPVYISFEKTLQHSIESLTLLHSLGYSAFKLVSQRNYLPCEYPPILEQLRYERAQRLLISRNFFLRVVRKLGARSWLQHEVKRNRYRFGWVFPPGSSGPFGEETVGKWQTFEEMLATVARANAAFDRREASVFWDDESYSFWADFHVKRNIQSKTA
jgi:hypothetical protein